MSELELRQIFKNQSDCYADTRMWDADGIETDGPVFRSDNVKHGWFYDYSSCELFLSIIYEKKIYFYPALIIELLRLKFKKK